MYECLPSHDQLLNGSPGIIYGIYQGDKVVKAKAFGERSIFTHKNMKYNMHMRIGSVTKSFTAMVILSLVEEEKLSLNDKVNDLLHSDLFNNITVNHLGTMSSGLPNYTSDSKFIKILESQPSKVWKPTELLKNALRHKPHFEPGRGWHYSNTNYILLGMIAEEVTGKTMAELYTEYIFDPLKLTETYVPITNMIGEPAPSGYMYSYFDDPSIGNNVLREVTEYYDPSQAYYAGYLISTLDDLKIFAKAFTEKVLEHECSFISTSFGQYGFGICKIGDWYGHDGSIYGFSSYMMYNPKYDITIITLCNMQANKDGLSPAKASGTTLIKCIDYAAKHHIYKYKFYLLTSDRQKIYLRL